MSRRALDAPTGDVVLVTEALAEQALSASRGSERKRMILPFHKSHADTLHRMFNALQPGTYVRPHRHLSVPKAEVFLVLRGAVEVVVFHDDGRVRDCFALRAGGPAFGLDLAPGLFHSFLVREADTLLYEVKAGPFSESTQQDFAAWAPQEGSPEVPAYLAALEAELARLAAGDATQAR
jgi:cupin fold WbuC family metalloprotein